MCKSIRDSSADYYAEYLNKANDTKQYQDRLKEILYDHEITDYTVAVNDNKAETTQHFQTVPMEMYKHASAIDDCKLIQLSSIKRHDNPFLLSDLEVFVNNSDENKLLFSGFISVFEIIQNYGYCDFYNISTKIGNNSTLMLSIAKHDLATWQFKRFIRKKSEIISHLLSAVSKSLPQNSKLSDILSPQELNVLKHVLNGFKYKEIARIKNVTEDTIKKQMLSARAKTGAASTKLLISLAHTQGIFD